MKKLISKLLSGTLALMFVGQIMIYGDGSSQGIVHAETINQIKKDIQLSKNVDELAFTSVISFIIILSFIVLPVPMISINKPVFSPFKINSPLYTAFDLLLLSYVILILISLHTQLITLFGCGDFRCS